MINILVTQAQIGSDPKQMNVEDLGEYALIQRVINQINSSIKPSDDIKVPMGDDAAVLAINPDMFCAVSTDLLVENIHFDFKIISPEEIGYKALAVNLSDLAAVAAVPKFVQVGMGIPSKTNISVVDEIYEGIIECANKYNVKITGGDMVKSQKITIAITAIGETSKKNIPQRCDAKVGESVCVTGELGSSALGLKLLRNKNVGIKFSKIEKQVFINAHKHPTPRIKEAIELLNFGIGALEDISDGLAADLTNICMASKVGSLIYEDMIPMPLHCLEEALRGGEDYELLFTIKKENLSSIKKTFKEKFNLQISEIGEILPENRGIKIELTNGRKKNVGKGFEHW